MFGPRYILSLGGALCLALGAWYAVSSAAPRPSQVPVLQPKVSEVPLYLIQPNDVLEILEWNEPKVSRNNVLVRPDGRISIPLAQDIQAAGLNPQQLKEVLQLKLKEGGVPAPEVTVIVTSIQSYVVYVIGSVAKNGPIASTKALNVLQALAMAGWTTQFGKKNEIVIFRGSGEETRKFNFNYDEFLSGKNNNQNSDLKSGDIVYVP